MKLLRLSLPAILLVISGCASESTRHAPVVVSSQAPSHGSLPAKPAATRHGGGYYLDDGPGDNPPPDIDAIADAEPKIEPLIAACNRPYTALGKTYVPETELTPYRAEGIASWYGRRYHGQRTSSGAPYDMYGMTAAHPTLPIPSYVRVTNPANGKSVVVRVNDRGPFRSDRLIDLSYTAAYKLGIIQNGSGRVIVESILPGNESVAATRPVPATQRIEENSLPVTSETDGIYLQLGAFSGRDNAEGFISRIRGQISDTPQIAQANGLFKVRVGPYPSREAALKTADAIAQSLEIRPVIMRQ